MRAINIIEHMDEWAKPELIDHWDNTGFQIGDKSRDISKILISLDLDAVVLKKAIKEGYEMIITHHPLIFKALKQITSENHNERIIMDLIKNDIVVYNAHSNLDLANGGVNDELANLLAISNTIPLATIGEGYGYGRIGTIKDTYLEEYIQFIKQQLHAESLIVYGDINRKVNKIAVCGGSGGDFVYNAYENGAEVYITGDIKYHEAQLGYDLGMTIIDAGHFNTEKIILPVIKRYLKEEFGSEIHIELVSELPVPYKIY